MEPLVSILIPAHNASRWIADTIQSALAQNWPRKEVIVVDDGSSDNTLAIAKQFSSLVTVQAQERQGAAAARNKALSLSQGNYIQWLDADDLLDPDKISRQMKAVNDSSSKRILLSGAWAYFWHRTSVAKFHSTPLWCDLSPAEWFVRKWDHNVHMQTATWLISRELTETAGIWDVRLSSNDDGEYLARVIKASDGIQFVPDARVFYRIAGPGSLSSIGQSRKKIESYLLGVSLEIRHMRSVEDSPRMRSACLRKLQRGYHNFYPNQPDLMLEVEELAVSLGGKLEVPQIDRKYLYLHKIFGLNATRRLRAIYNRSKWAVVGAWDAILLYLEKRSLFRKARS